MPDIHLRRAHRLGLARAREVAWQWAEEVERSFDMTCTVIEGETADSVEFVRPGVRGVLQVSGDAFELEATLGFLLGAFSRTIEAEIERKLDDLLDGERRRATAARAAAKKAAATPPAGKKAAATATPTAAAKKVPAKKVPATEAPARKAPARKAPAKKAVAPTVAARSPAKKAPRRG